jgi:hypothetical protein
VDALPRDAYHFCVVGIRSVRLVHFEVGRVAGAVVLIAITACGSGTRSARRDNAGGVDAGETTGTGGRTHTGGRSHTGGTSSAGGATPTGNGGATASGGFTGAGGFSSGGAPGVGGLVGTGGGLPGISPLGTRCLGNPDCKQGLGCLTSTGNGFGSGGPPGGLCTFACASDADCQSADPNSVCVLVDSATAAQFCLQTCQAGVSDPSKCQGRTDMVCNQLVDSNGLPSVSACQPACGGDFDCPGRRCDLRSGTCMVGLSGSLPIGSPCDANATTDPCNGVCYNAYDPPADPSYGACTALCSLSSNGSGCGISSTTLPPHPVACFGTPSSAQGDAGLCFQLCDCNDDCLNKAFICRPFNDSASTASTGHLGSCRGPVDSTGAPVPDLKCGVPPAP